MPSAIPATAYRLGPETRAHLEAIRRHYGLPSEAAAVRYAAARVAESITRPESFVTQVHQAAPKEARKR